ncbi:hypothetical protein N4T77_00770 [Clostridium sp. CX1]|uniref:hypothetical protein n=1 Tax=Clostridium sp. CX1 TaxID=2978346 RepID=UPI0021BF4DF6|nr:hypothetical protein [Clostridium sp. CX1]MCT8975123.1 hypothetical protein [Clostridium sp. CX1]
MDKRDSERIVQLAREGKQISKIWEEDFPQYDYWDIYIEVYAAGEKSSLGTKRMITNRLYKLTSLPKKEQDELIKEIDELVCYLYNRYKESQQKLDDIRGVINR